MIPSALTLLFSLFGAVAVNGEPEESFSLRLVDGPGRCQGELQFQRSGQDWVGVRPYSVTLLFGQRLCLELGCGSAVSVKETSVSERESVGLSSDNCEDRPLIQCFHRTPKPSQDSVQLVCAESVRLVSGQTSCSGSLQIKDQSSWTSVCDGALGSQGAEVACRELGCGDPVLQGALSPLGQMFQCKGSESALKDCPQTEPKTCSGPAQNLTCSESVRLIGGATRCQGNMELEHRGEWRRVHPRGPWDLGTAASVCQSLDCGAALFTTDRKDGQSSIKTWFVDHDCVKKKATVRDCIVDSEESEVPQPYGVEVVCSESVRLVSGRSQCSGSLQIMENSSWTSVCDGALGSRGAEVLCKELGCGAPLLQGALSPLGQTFQCKGSESALMDCPRNLTRTQTETCSGPALNLTCLEPTRLLGGAHRCEGTLEVQYRGEWRRVAASYSWRHHAGDSVCRGLDCGGVISTEFRIGFNKSNVWQALSDCVSKSTVRECIPYGLSDDDGGVEVTCKASTGIQIPTMILVLFQVCMGLIISNI